MTTNDITRTLNILKSGKAAVNARNGECPENRTDIFGF